MAEKELRLGYVRGRDGTNGTNGKDGVDGKSAYQAAVEKGYTGTEEEFNTALAGMENAPFLPLSGGTMTGPLLVDNPTQGGQAANKGYVDGLVGNINSLLDAINGEVV